MIATLLSRLRSSDRGSAIVEFTLVVPLVVAVALASFQLALALHVRSTLTAAAAEGARAGALAGSGPGVAEQRTRAMLAEALGGDGVTDVSASRTRMDGVPVVEVRVTARLPLLGMLGPTSLHVDGHAVQERP